MPNPVGHVGEHLVFVALPIAFGLVGYYNQMPMITILFHDLIFPEAEGVIWGSMPDVIDD